MLSVLREALRDAPHLTDRQVDALPLYIQFIGYWLGPRWRDAFVESARRENARRARG